MGEFLLVLDNRRYLYFPARVDRADKKGETTVR